MTTRAELRAEKPRRPLLRSFRFWIPVGILLLLLVLVVVGLLIGKPIYDRAMSAKSSLEQAIPLATTAKNQILAGDNEGAKATAAQLATLTADARDQTDDGTWKSLESVPFVGPNLHAVRTAAVVTDDLVTGALTPATNLSLKALTPVDGAINIAAITDMQAAVTRAADAVEKAAADLGSIDHDSLIPQVEGALTQLTDAVDEMQPLVGPAKEIIGILPTALGAEAPRNYLMVFQNNAESRGTGGNPAAIVMITADQGRISITQQASSADFKNGRPEPVIALNPETEDLYGSKIGRYVMDTTLSPDFTETAGLIRAFWAESFGTPVDAVVSFDPVALSYLLAATGPTVINPPSVEIDGSTYQVIDQPIELTSENAVSLLLSQVYSLVPEPQLQDAFFAAAASSIFDGLLSGKADTKALLDSLTKAVDEGRLMYAPSAEAEVELVADSRLSGRLPTDNAESTIVGVYVNDVTEGKLDYYMQLDVTAASTQCTTPDAPVFSTSATLTNTIAADQAAALADYVAPGRFFTKGTIGTDLVLYGPVGATAATVTIDGQTAQATVLPHLGRPAVKVPVQNTPGQTHTVEATFTATAGEYGPLDIQHTPMVRTVGEQLTVDGCG